MKPSTKLSLGLILGLMAFSQVSFTRAASASECAPETALLWLRLGIAVGQNSDAPTQEELVTLLTSIDDPETQPGMANQISSGLLSPSSEMMAQEQDNRGLAGIETETFWIRVGMPESPMIYMIIDPTCPFCSQGLQKLAPLISSGQLQVRIVLVPFLHEVSTTLAAELILADNPAEAIWTHEIINEGHVDFAALGQNRDRIEELGAKGLRWLQANLEWMRKRQLNSVPLYVWAEPGKGNDGEVAWQILSGVQEPALFQAALPPAEPTEASFGLPAAKPGPKTTASFLDSKSLPLE